MPHYKLTYFDYRGYGDAIRMALTHANVPFEEVRIAFHDATWTERIKTPFNYVPILEIDGQKVLPESLAILRYIGEQHGLQASDSFDRALGDAIASTWSDAYTYWTAVDWPTLKWDLAKVEQEHEKISKPRFKFIDEHLSKSKSGYLTCDKPTWVDFHVYNYVEMLKKVFHAPADSYPNLVKFLKKMEELPAVKSVLQKRPNESWWGAFPGPYGPQ